MSKTRILAIGTLTVLTLSGCIGNDPEIAIPALKDGASAAYTISGVPLNTLTGVFGQVDDGDQPTSIPFTDMKWRVQSEGPMEVIGPDGAPWAEAYRLTYDVHDGSAWKHMMDDFMLGDASIATNEWVYVGKMPDGQNIPTHNWARGTPDVLWAGAFAGKTWTSGTYVHHLASPPWSLWAQEIGNEITFHLSTTDIVEARMDLDTTLDGDRFESYIVKWDTACPFPLSVHLQRPDGSFAFSATRTACTPGEGTPLDSGDASRLLRPSSLMEAPKALPDYAIDVEIDQVPASSAWDRAREDLQSACGPECTIVGTRFRYVEADDDQPQVPLVPTHNEPPVPQWEFAGRGADGTIHYSAWAWDGEYHEGQTEAWDVYGGSGNRTWTMNPNAWSCILSQIPGEQREFSVVTRAMVPASQGAGLGQPLALFRNTQTGAGAFSLQWLSQGYGFLASYNGPLEMNAASC